MKMKNLAATLVLGIAAAAQGQTLFDQAAQEYRNGRWSAAYGRFVALANEGDADAARIALFMHRNGPLLYRSYWDASTDEIEDWTRLAALRSRRPDPVFRPQEFAALKPAVQKKKAR